MKSILKNISVAAAMLLTFGCSTSPMGGEFVGEQGGVELNLELSDTRAGDGIDELNALKESSVVKFYNSADKLVRYFTGVADESITEYLAVGKYYVTLTAGEEVAATFDDEQLYYFGKSPMISIYSKQTTSTKLTATMQNVMFSIAFDDETLGDHFSKYRLDAYAANSAAEITDETPRLKYESTDDGYFLMEEDTQNIVWQFYGDDAIVAQGVIEGVKSAHQYKLSFKYTDYLNVTPLSVNLEDPESHDDTFGFKVQPLLKSVDFDVDETQILTDGASYQFSVTSFTPISHINVTVDGVTYSSADADSGVSYDPTTTLATITSKAFDAVILGGIKSVDVAAIDTGNASGLAHMNVAISGFSAMSNVDFWENNATFEVYTATSDVQDVKVRYRYKGDTEWSASFAATTSDDNIWSAKSVSEWNSSTNAANLKISTLTRGILPSKEYECQAIIDGVEGNIVPLTTASTTQEVPYGTLNDGLSCYTQDNTENDVEFWASGNNSYTSSLCSYDTSTKCPKLKAKNANYVVINVFAAGNLYSGTFDMGSASGTANFGQKFNWLARPTSLKFDYMATVGSGDKCRVFIAIVNWTARRGVTVKSSSSASSPPEGDWDPETKNSQSEGTVIAYGSVLFDKNTSSFAQCTVPINYYFTDIKPSPDNYSIIISAATSYRGNYTEGSEDSTLWVDNFEFGY